MKTKLVPAPIEKELSPPRYQELQGLGVERGRAVGAPRKIDDAKQVSVRLDPTSIQTAKRLGAGNVSKGIRISLMRSAERDNKIRK